MSNKGLTFLIIILLLLCVGTFGAFYLKVNPQMPLSQKIFGQKVSNINDENIVVNNPPVNGFIDNQNQEIVENVVPDIVVETIPEQKEEIVNPEPKKEEVKEEIVVKEKPTISIKNTLKKGSKGDEVKILQQFLTDNQYLNDKIDGVFGPVTESAVKKFQTEYKITVDGIVGGNTQKIINELLSTG